MVLRSSRFALLVCITCLCFASAVSIPAVSAQDESAKKKSSKNDALTLEKLFPKEGLFGPEARSMAFSPDGRYAAFLWRPLVEKRHGSDLYLYDVEKNSVRRVTSADRMQKYNKSAREVIEDRKKTAKKKSKKKAKSGTADSKSKSESKKDSKKPDQDQGRVKVDEDDHKAEKAPRWGGVSSFSWAPKKAEMILLCGGDLYRLDVAKDSLERLTATRSAVERGFEYLPTGDGFVFRQGGVRRVRFGSHLVEEIDPPLGKAETISSFSLSPDGEKMVIMARKSNGSSSSRKVKIANYRDRFMKVREVSRKVSDDPISNRESTIHVVELGDPSTESAKVKRVWSRKTSGPRDVLRLPEWSLDSKKLVFAEFDQKTEKVRIVEINLDPPKVDEEKKRDDRSEEDDKSTAKAEGDGSDESGTEKKEAEKKEDPESKLHATTKVIYEFSHEGGPNTPRMMRPWFNADGSKVAMLTELSGFRHLHLIDPLYQSCDQLTRGRFEVYPIDISDDHRKIYVTATKEDAACQDIYAVDLETGDMTRLTKERGVYDRAAVSPKGDRALAIYRSFGSPKELVAVDIAQGRQHALTDSHPKETAKLTEARPEFFQYKNRHGHEIHGHVFKPDDWTPKDQRPLLLYVYGGPLGTRKQVSEGNYHYDSYFLAMYMAKKHGWVTATIDPRGMSGYGGAFEKANFEQVGKPQVEDLVDGARFLCKHHGVDEKRMAIHGWSFGGFQTQMCLYTEPDVFAAGIAGAGPTEWENYNSWYSTGTIGNSRQGTPDLKKYSLLPLAKNLKGKLLLVHGMEDSNVLYQDTVRVYRELLKADKETLVELFLDPTGGHGLGGDIKRVNRARKYEEFLLRTLETGKPAAAPIRAEAAAPPTEDAESSINEIGREAGQRR